MTVEDLKTRISKKTGVTKNDVHEVVKNFTIEIENELARGGKVTLVGFGTFEVVERSARNGRNPRTGEPIQIPKRKVVAFRTGKLLKKRISETQWRLKAVYFLRRQQNMILRIGCQKNKEEFFKNLCSCSLEFYLYKLSPQYPLQ